MEIADLIVGARYQIECPGEGEGYEGGAIYKGLAADVVRGIKYPPGTLVFECDDGEEGFFGIENVRWEIARWEKPAHLDTRDLKRVLMELGNAMVKSYGFRPAIGQQHSSIGDHTECIRCFTEWMNYHPEAREALKELGFDWSM